MSNLTKGGRELVSKIIVGKDLKDSIKKAVNLIGGFAKVIEKGDTVIVKPNFNTNDTFPGSSDPSFVKCVIELLYDAGAKKVILAESSCFHTNSRKMMSSIIPIAQKAGAEVVIVDEINDWHAVEVNGKNMKKLNVARIYSEKPKKTKFVWLPCMKTHKQARFTLSLKLPMGMLKGTDRMKMHVLGLQTRIADLNLAVVAPDLIIMDGRKCFITGGPCKGDVREPSLIMASGDRIAIDVEAVKVIQEFEGNSLGLRSPWDFTQIRNAVANKIGKVKKEEDYKVVYSDTISK